MKIILISVLCLLAFKRNVKTKEQQPRLMKRSLHSHELQYENGRSKYTSNLHSCSDTGFPEVEYPTTIFDTLTPFYYKTKGCEIMGSFPKNEDYSNKKTNDKVLRSSSDIFCSRISEKLKNCRNNYNAYVYKNQSILDNKINLNITESNGPTNCSGSVVEIKPFQECVTLNEFDNLEYLDGSKKSSNITCFNENNVEIFQNESVNLKISEPDIKCNNYSLLDNNIPINSIKLLNNSSIDNNLVISNSNESIKNNVTIKNLIMNNNKLYDNETHIDDKESHTSNINNKAEDISKHNTFEDDTKVEITLNEIINIDTKNNKIIDNVVDNHMNKVTIVIKIPQEINSKDAVIDVLINEDKNLSMEQINRKNENSIKIVAINENETKITDKFHSQQYSIIHENNDHIFPAKKAEIKNGYLNNNIDNYANNLKNNSNTFLNENPSQQDYNLVKKYEVNKHNNTNNSISQENQIMVLLQYIKEQIEHMNFKSENYHKSHEVKVANEIKEIPKVNEITNKTNNITENTIIIIPWLNNVSQCDINKESNISHYNKNQIKNNKIVSEADFRKNIHNIFKEFHNTLKYRNNGDIIICDEYFTNASSKSIQDSLLDNTTCYLNTPSTLKPYINDFSEDNNIIMVNDNETLICLNIIEPNSLKSYNNRSKFIKPNLELSFAENIHEVFQELCEKITNKSNCSNEVEPNSLKSCNNCFMNKFNKTNNGAETYFAKNIHEIFKELCELITTSSDTELNSLKSQSQNFINNFNKYNNVSETYFVKNIHEIFKELCRLITTTSDKYNSSVIFEILPKKDKLNITNSNGNKPTRDIIFPDTDELAKLYYVLHNESFADNIIGNETCYEKENIKKSSVIIYDTSGETEANCTIHTSLGNENEYENFFHNQENYTIPIVFYINNDYNYNDPLQNNVESVFLNETLLRKDIVGKIEKEDVNNTV